MLNPKEPKKTQGRTKMLRYLEDLIRNKNFLRTIKKMRKQACRDDEPNNYYEKSKEQRERHDYINNELGDIINGYEKLRKRCIKVLQTKDFLTKEEIAENYGLDMHLIWLAEAMIDKDENAIKSAIVHADPDMCKIYNRLFEEIIPFNPAEEIVHLRKDRKLDILAYPGAIVINAKASKRDVLDFVEKRWKEIDNCVRDVAEMKILKLKNRKFSQEMIDYIWDNRALKAKEIQNKLDEIFPKHGLAYFEISKLILAEKQRRSRNIM